METFSLATRIPTSARDTVWTLVRNDIGFRAWQAINCPGIKTRDLTKTHLVAAVADLGLNDAVMTAIGNGIVTSGGRYAPLSPAEAEASAHDTEGNDNGETNEEIDARIEAKLGEAHAEGILSALRPFLAPALLDKVSEGLVPLVDLANKPPVEIERIVEISNASVGTVVAAASSYARRALPSAAQIETSTLSRSFGIRGAFGPLPCGVWNAQDAPAKDPAYVVDNQLVANVVSAMEDGDYIWLAGPAGSGKTSLPVHIAATTHRPFVRIAFNRATDPVDLIGSDKLTAPGVMGWVDGVLTAAIRRPGTIILLDEPTLVPPGIAGMLQTLLDMRFLTLPTGEVVKCAKGVWFVAADNTRGFGDEGRYAGTMQANAAFVDRFARMIVVDYMDAAKEATALVNHTGAPKPACERVAQFVKAARGLAGFETVPLSLRRMNAFVKMTMRGFDPAMAFADCFETRLPEADRETLRQAFRANFDVSAYAAELSGSPVPAPVSNAPEQAAARNAFDRLA